MFDLHYWPTPNGKKVTILLEETGLPYKIIPVNIGRGDQFKEEFLAINPNHRMPVLVDHEPQGGGAPIGIFESGAIMMYLAEKAGRFWPQDVRAQIRGRPVGDLADGQPGPEARRVRAFPPARRQAGRPVLRRPPLHRRGQPPLRRAQHAALEAPLSRRRRVHDRRHDLLSLDGELAEPGPGHRGVHRISSAGSRNSAPAPRCSAASRWVPICPRTHPSSRQRSRTGAPRCSTTSAPVPCRPEPVAARGAGRSPDRSPAPPPARLRRGRTAAGSRRRARTERNRGRRRRPGTARRPSSSSSRRCAARRRRPGSARARARAPAARCPASPRPPTAADTPSQTGAVVSVGNATASASAAKTSRSAALKPMRSARLPASNGPAIAPRPNTTQ